MAPAGVPGSAPQAASFEPPDVARLMVPFLRQLADTKDAREFSALVAPVEPQIRALLEQGHAATVWRLRSTLDMIAAERPSETGESRASAARMPVRVRRP